MPSKLEITPAVITQVADAVVDALAGGEFSEDLAETREVQRFDTQTEALDQVPPGKVRLAVLPAGVRRQQLTRGSKQLECDISVAIIRQIDPNEEDQFVGDRMQKLAEELAEYLEDTPLQTGLNVKQQDTTIKLLYSQRALEKQLYFIPITFSYRVRL
jgi:hypothetical protein